MSVTKRGLSARPSRGVGYRGRMLVSLGIPMMPVGFPTAASAETVSTAPIEVLPSQGVCSRLISDRQVAVRNEPADQNVRQPAPGGRSMSHAEAVCLVWKKSVFGGSFLW